MLPRKLEILIHFESVLVIILVCQDSKGYKSKLDYITLHVFQKKI